MVKEDYEIVAKVIKERYIKAHKNLALVDSIREVEMLILDLMVCFQKDNKRFNRAKFLDACGVEY